MRGSPENAAALVNGMIVLLAPAAFLLIGWVLTGPQSAASSTFRPSGWEGTSTLHVVAIVFLQVELVVLPFAALAAWRTRHYARGWRDRHDHGWKAVAEAAACGLLVALGVLAHGILTRPRQAPPYVSVYGGIALVLGAVVGLILRTTALLVLKLRDDG